MHRIIKRIGQSILTIFTVMTVSFGLIRMMPGGPTDFLRGQLQQAGGANQEQINQLVQTYININPDKPVWRQYIDYIVALAQGDLGQSIWYGEPVAEVLLGALPWTVFVMTSAVLLSFIISVVWGAMMAYNESSSFDIASTGIAILSSSVPYYLAGVILLMIIAYPTPIFPTGGRVGSDVGGFSLEFLGSALHHAALPIISLVITGVGNMALAMRGNSISVLGEDYLRVARLRGLSSNRISTRYVARNAVLPLYTGLLIRIGNVFGGSIILEVIFNYRGVGYYLYQAVSARDYPLLMGGFIIITVAVVIALLIADLTYGMIDPRAGEGGSNESY